MQISNKMLWKVTREMAIGYHQESVINKIYKTAITQKSIFSSCSSQIRLIVAFE
jgi:hypothetical protein